MSVNKPTTGLLLIGHGTRDLAGQRECQIIMAKVEAAVAPQPVEAGYLELTEPTVGEALKRLADRGAREVRVVPLLLFEAGHAKSDVPAAIRQVAADLYETVVDIAPPFELHDHIVSLSERRFQEALAQRPPLPVETIYWLLVGRGSSDSTATRSLSQFAAMRARRSSLSRFGHCYVAAARPALAEGLATAASFDVKRVVVQPHLLFRGAVLNDIAAAVCNWQSKRPDIDWVTVSHLGPEQEVVNAVLDRFWR
jgi:sirohydrochlorin cobaltochelatase